MRIPPKAAPRLGATPANPVPSNVTIGVVVAGLCGIVATFVPQVGAPQVVQAATIVATAIAAFVHLLLSGHGTLLARLIQALEGVAGQQVAGTLEVRTEPPTTGAAASHVTIISPAHLAGSDVAVPPPAPEEIGVALVHDPAVRKLGRKPPREDPRTFRLARYLRAQAPPATAVDWTTKVTDWGMMGNDKVGDCTCAAAGHLIECWTSWVDPQPVMLADPVILAAYSAVSGYNPADPATDQGADMLTVMNYWRQTGVGGHKISGFAAVNPTDQNELRSAIGLFGGVNVGLNMPVSAQGQQVWDVPADPSAPDAQPGSWGGHDVPYLGYNATGPVGVTWGSVVQITWAFHEKYCDECFAAVSPDFLASSGIDPQGFNLAQLLADLATIPPAS